MTEERVKHSLSAIPRADVEDYSHITGEEVRSISTEGRIEGGDIP